MLSLDLNTEPHDRATRERKRRFQEGFLHIFPKVHAYIKFKTDMTFKKLRKGGQYRGVNWPPFKSPWAYRGGTKKGKGGGRTRKRIPSSQASLVQDTMNLRRNAASSVFVASKNKFSVGNRIVYGPWQQAMRPYLFFEEGKDEVAIGKIMAGFILAGDRRKS